MLCRWIRNLPFILLTAGSMAMSGKDRLGWVYVGLTKRSAQEYEQTIVDSSVKEPEEAVRYALWGIFNMVVYERPLPFLSDRRTHLIGHFPYHSTNMNRSHLLDVHARALPTGRDGTSGLCIHELSKRFRLICHVLRTDGPISWASWLTLANGCVARSNCRRTTRPKKRKASMNNSRRGEQTCQPAFKPVQNQCPISSTCSK